MREMCPCKGHKKYATKVRVQVELPLKNGEFSHLCGTKVVGIFKSWIKRKINKGFFNEATLIAD